MNARRYLLRIYFSGVLCWFCFTLYSGATWPMLQSRYFHDYVDYLGAYSKLQGQRDFWFLYIRYPNGWRRAENKDVLGWIPPAERAKSATGFALSSHAQALGATKLEWRFERIDHATAYEWFRQRIYQGKTPWELVRWFTLPGLVYLGWVVGTIVKDRRIATRNKQGYILRGPHVVTPSEFNRLRHSDGIGFETFEQLKRWQRLFRREPRRCVLRIGRHEETSHFSLAGDTGTGKSQEFRYVLGQVRARGEAAIVYDPAMEFTPEFYDPVTDVILNPVDQRVPYWTPSDEILHPAEALALAGSLFPDKPRENTFFTEAARKIFAHLMRYRPTPQELAFWLKHPEEIDRRIAGTELEAMIPRSAPGQRAAVLATLNQIAAAFQLLPSEREARGRWSAVSWARNPKGIVFFPSVPAHRDSLRPLYSMWLDSLFLRLLEFGRREVPVWVFVDELGSLQRLPQLATVITEGRKANIRLVLGFQGRSQLHALYGHQAEVMLSQPMTKIFLRTSEPDAAEWISRSIGEVEIMRLEISHTEGHSGLLKFQQSKTSHWQRRTEPLVMASTIASLHNQTGYLKSRDLVVPISIPYRSPVLRQPALLPRPLPGLEALTLAGAAANQGAADESGAAEKPSDQSQTPKTEKGHDQGADAELEIFE